MKYEIRSNVINGNLKRNRNLILEALNSFEGQEITITLQKAKKRRSNPQNSFYHAVCVPIMQQCLKDAGYLMTLEQTHEMLKLRFLKESILVNEQTAEYIERIKSTTELSTIEFMEYILDIQKFAIEYFNTEIPDPNQNITLAL
jgi:hypothetical protein